MQPTHVHSFNAVTTARISASITKLSTAGPGGCIVWTGSLDRHGYGIVRFRLAGVVMQTGSHRAAWIITNGPLAPGLIIDHLCRNRSCVNPEHLEPVTTGENNRRSDLIGRSGRKWARELTVCTYGHEFTPENTHLHVARSGYTHRVCIQCRRRRSAEYKARLRAAA